MSEIVELAEAVKVYKRGKEEVFALAGITFSIREGDFLAFVGPSGSGKTTLLNIIGCIDRLTRGRIKLCGEDLTYASDATLTRIRREKIGFVFQQFFLIPTLTALENVSLPGIFNRTPKRQERALELLALLGLEKKKDARPTQLSGGEMQRVAIARALINNPKIILADEPTGNLDSRNAHQVFELFQKLNEKGLTIIVVTHNLELAKMASRIIYLEDGRIKQ
jgi:putative ABC transport system ATP-binding protein